MFDDGGRSITENIIDNKISELVKFNQKDFQLLSNEVVSIKRDIESLKNISPNQKISSVISSIEEKINSVTSKMEIIETAIVENPERAMSLPILRRDMDALSSDLRGDLAALRTEVDRVYDLNKWFIGLMATMSVGVLGIASKNLWSRE